jgi:hypothetical protein
MRLHLQILGKEVEFSKMQESDGRLYKDGDAERARSVAHHRGGPVFGIPILIVRFHGSAAQYFCIFKQIRNLRGDRAQTAHTYLVLDVFFLERTTHNAIRQLLYIFGYQENNV